jgi:hypothetical protein
MSLITLCGIKDIKLYSLIPLSYGGSSRSTEKSPKRIG